MYDLNILIADDEPSICDTLSSSIMLDKIGLKIAGISSNGKDLLEKIETIHPDIVITDICMPLIDGLEVISQARQKGIICKFIIISEYKIFEYAYSALKYHVEDYLLKPFDMDNLNSILGRIADEIRLKEDTTLPHESNAASRQLFLKIDINKLKNSPKSISQINQLYGTVFKDGLFRALIIKLDCTSNSNIMLVFDNDTFRDKLVGLVFKHLKKHCYDIIIDKMSDGVLILLNYSLQYQTNINNAIEALFSETKNVFKSIRGIRVTLCVSREYSETSKLTEAKFEVLDARWSRMEIGNDKIIYSKDMNTNIEYSTYPNQQLQKLSEQIEHAYEVLDVEKGHHYLSEFFNLPHSFLSTREARTFTRNMIDKLFEMYLNLASSNSDADTLKHEFIYLVNMASSFDKLKETFYTHMSQVINQIIVNVNKQYSKPVREAITYIGTNYRKPITLNIIAKEVNLTPTYFTSIFRKETGQKFSDYVALYKITQAKKQLMNSDKNISEIADELGYSDVRSFSKLFKKSVGINPTEYKKIYR